MGAKTGVLHEIRVGEYSGPLTLRVVGLQTVKEVLGHLRLSLSHVKQVEVIEHVVHLLVRRILVGEPAQRLLAQRQVVELILENDAAMMQSVHDDEVGGFHLLVGERYVFQIVFTLVGVVLCAVGNLCQRVLHGSRLEERVALFIGEHFVLSSRGHHGLVDALPVVNVLTLSPLALERLLTLTHSHRIIEIPGAALVAHSRLWLVLRRPVIVVTVAHGTLT